MTDLSEFPPHRSLTRGALDPTRRALITQRWPHALTDAQDWLEHDDTFVRLARDVIKLGIADLTQPGPRVHPTPSQARTEWQRLIDAMRAHH